MSSRQKSSAERTNTGEKPHPCSVCARRFNTRSKAAVHERIHTSEKPYSYSICTQRFNEKSGVTRHERTHTGEKPYPAPSAAVP